MRHLHKQTQCISNELRAAACLMGEMLGGSRGGSGGTRPCGLGSRRRQHQVPSYGPRSRQRREKRRSTRKRWGGVMDSKRFHQFCLEMDLAHAGNGLNSMI
jgi:hypothetical protein